MGVTVTQFRIGVPFGVGRKREMGRASSPVWIQHSCAGSHVQKALHLGVNALLS